MRFLNPIPYLRSGSNFTAILRKHHSLLFILAKREISQRYVGQALGMFWAFFHPLVMLGVYYFLFSVVIKIRIPTEMPGMPSDYFLYIISGLAPWLAFAESTNKGPSSINSQASLVKQVVFPIEILPICGVLTSLLPFAIMGSLILIYKIFQGVELFPGLILLPFAILLQLTLCVGLNLITSAVGVYLRDLKNMIQTFMTIVIYTMPLFYLPHMVPAPFRPILDFNPFSHFIWCWQDVFYYNGMHHPWSWLIVSVSSLLILGIGTRIFAFLKTFFGNLL